MYEQKIVEENERKIACAMPFGAKLALLSYRVLGSWSDSLVPLRQALLHLRNVWTFLRMRTPSVRYILRMMMFETRSENSYQTSITSLDDDLGCGGDGSTLKERKVNWDDRANGVTKTDRVLTVLMYSFAI